MGHRKSKTRWLHALAAATALLVAWNTAGAQELKDQARNAAIGDGLSTAVGLAAGAVEMNPLGPILAIGMKTVTLRYIESLPDSDQPRAYALASSTWSAATANNLCVTAAILTGGGFAPACIAVGIAWGLKTWQDSEPERQFWAGCALLRIYAEQPELQCIYTPPTAVAAEDVVITAQALQAP